MFLARNLHVWWHQRVFPMDSSDPPKPGIGAQRAQHQVAQAPSHREISPRRACPGTKHMKRCSEPFKQSPIYLFGLHLKVQNVDSHSVDSNSSHLAHRPFCRLVFPLYVLARHRSGLNHMNTPAFRLVINITVHYTFTEWNVLVESTNGIWWGPSASWRRHWNATFPPQPMARILPL